MPKPSDFTVGQKLYFVPFRYSNVNAREVEVVAIGRKWIAIDRDWQKSRFDAESMFVDGGDYTSPGRVYMSQQAYEAEVIRNEKWDSIASHFKRTSKCPEFLDSEALEKMCELLRVGK